MKIFFSILTLFVVSVCAGQLKPKTLDYELNKTYEYEYIGSVLNGIPSSSSLYSGTQLKANVAISHLHHSTYDLYSLKLDNITFHSLIDEVTDPVKANFVREETLEQEARDTLEYSFQYHINKETQTLEWIEFYHRDEPWSMNIKKAIIEMFLVDITGKQLQLNLDYEHGSIRRSQDDVYHTFDVYEPTLKGKCQTMYQVVNDLPESIKGLDGIDQFYWKVTKTRNYQNCNNASVSTQHNWARKDCAGFCKKTPIFGGNSAPKESQCSCDKVDAEVLDQQSTSTYLIECKENPFILNAESNSKVIFDNYGTKFVSYAYQTLVYKRIHGDVIDVISSMDSVRVPSLVFSLYPYSPSKVYNHEIPIYNLLIPQTSQMELVDNTVELLTQVSNAVIGVSEDVNKQKIASIMQRIILNLAHIDSKYILKIYQEYCVVEKNELYTNTLNSVRRQLFLDAIAHVGTQSTATWLEKVIDSDSNGLFPIEVRQVIETLPLNVYSPSTRLIDLMDKKIRSYIAAEDWDSLSVFVIAYGKLIARACPNVDSSDPNNEINVDESLFPSKYWWIPETDKCTRKQTNQYLTTLDSDLVHRNSARGRVLIAQALALTGKSLAFEILAPHASNEFKCELGDISECVFFRTSVIYSLHHLVPVEPERIRSLVLPIFNRKTESYEVRLAAFDVLMSAGPKRHELDSVAATLHDETNLQVISMVRSVLKETANLTNPCDQPLAQAAREIIATLPEVNLDGIYSQASYNEWYSTDKSTGFFANGQFVANNITAIPRRGYFNIGSNWKSLSNPWLTVAFQQKGLESALRKLLNPISTSTKMNPKIIDELWRDREFLSRDEDEFMLELFIRVYKQTSLFTMDKHTLKRTYNQLTRILHDFVSDNSKLRVGLNWVRFYMPSTYNDVVPSAIGLPIAALKQNIQIVSLRLVQHDGLIERTTFGASKAVGSIAFKATPQIFTSSHSSLSVFNQGIKTKTHYGVYRLQNFAFHVPLNLAFGWHLAYKWYTYSIQPIFNDNNLHLSNTNFAFIAPSYIGTKVKLVTKEIQSLVPAYTHPLTQLKSPEFGMNLNINMSTERPWFVDFTQIPCEGTVAWLFEKYNEMNQFNHNINLTLVQNDQFPSTGISAVFNFRQYFGGDFVHFENNKKSDSYGEIPAEKLIKLYPSKINNPAFFARKMTHLVTIINDQQTQASWEVTLIKAIDYHAYWYEFDVTLDNKIDALWKGVPRRLVINGKLERSIILSDLKLQPEKSEEIVGNYIANISWAHDVTTEQLDTEILINGELKRVAPDPVIPEMDPRSWFHRQCEKDIKNGNATNYACEQLYAQQAYFNVITGKIEFREVEKPVRESIRMVYSELKRSLISYWKPWSTVSIKKNEGERDAVNFEAAFSNLIYKRPVINLFVQTPNELVNFTKLFVPVAPFPTLIPTEYLKASSLPKDQTCTVMKDSIRTFDNVTYYTWIDECEFVAAMDCAEESKQFAVTVKGKAGKRSVRVYTPLKTFFKVWDVKKDVASLTVYGVDGVQLGKDYLVEAGKPALHVSANGIEEAHRVFMQDGVVNIILPSENVRVAFDGHYLKITTSPFYLGKTCGLCGNQNQEFTSEFLDPKMNDLASNLTAFRDSYSLHGCTDPNPCHKNGCELEKPVAHYRRRNYIASPKKTTKTSNPYGRTIVERRDNLDCFSKYPQMACKENEKAAQTVSMPIHWVCFGQEHALHKQWIEQADRRVIYEAATFETTESKIYEAPTECDKESVRGI